MKRRASSPGPAGRAASRPGPSRPAAGLDRLWAPWRMGWIRAASAPGAGADRKVCLFCAVAAAANDKDDLVLARRPHALLMLNRYPYATAHLMVAVAEHKGRFHELADAERADLLELVSLAEVALGSEYAPDGVNYGLNVGRVAGAGFPDHLHLHMVPRWNGDTNFMPEIALTRVLPESLADTWKRMRDAIVAAGSRPARAGSQTGNGARPKAGAGRRPRGAKGR